ncbi:DNA alkylation repair protein [Leptospira idonii]|uniref:DNA alkylation repair protein n=1 Tax=Leptospira idonii TaxID=1193500 RepID=A0A4R9LYY7_9LEPT|nr:DNA alkylation repair protein [Leptospira idonii]TGN18942.1 DNA alkylation repair protein [Leptospira idonii]
MEPLKYIYSDKFISALSQSLVFAYQELDAKGFKKEIFSSPWENLELKERMSRISDTIIEFLPKDLDLLFPILKDTIDHLRKEGTQDFNFAHMFFPEIVQKAGLSDFEKSMKALEFITVFASAEFAIRSFYLHYPEKTNKQMLSWSKHKHPMVRRLASEGSRPLLPWAMGVPDIKKRPEQSLTILENLWDDENEIVRRSVANHLNDISKINPDITWSFCKPKFGKSKETDKSLKHALRTLLKKGNKEILSAYSYDIKWKPTKLQLKLPAKEVSVGKKLEFEIKVFHKEKKSKKIRTEYVVSFLLANGKWGNKVFQLGDKELVPGETLEIKKSHSFAPITTRTYYPGKHQLTIVINGNEVAKQSFELKKGKK